jgi:hypothetical protein
MAAATITRLPLKETLSTVALPLAAQHVYGGTRACWDTSTGTIKKAAVGSTTLVPIGIFEQDADNTAAGAPYVNVILDREIMCQWFDNDGTNTVVAANLGGTVYLTDDHTVGNLSTGNSAAGRAWKLDTVKGVLVQLTTL